MIEIAKGNMIGLFPTIVDPDTIEKNRLLDEKTYKEWRKREFQKILRKQVFR